MRRADPKQRVERYVRWLSSHADRVIAGGAIVLVVSALLTTRYLPLRADLAYLLPQDSPAVRDLRRLSQRLAARDTALVIITARSPEARADAVERMAASARALPRDLVERVDTDDAATRAFVRAHRHLLVPLPELVEARDALREAIERRKLAANPLYVELDDAPPASSDARLDRLRERRAEVEHRLARSSFTSADGTTGLVVVKTAFPTTDVERGQRLLAALASARAAARAEVPGVDMGFTGGVTTTVAEHAALVGGIVSSSAITGVLVLVLLLAYFRSLRLLVLLAIPLVTATLMTFAIAVFTVGHLNAATAFLGAVIAGNGINYGILLLGRLVEEQRADADRRAAMAAAIRGTLVPTLVASLGAAIAYGSLAATSFRGFADFAAVGAVGMIACWLTSFTLLPALLLRFAPAGARPQTDRFGRALAAVFARWSPRTAGAVVLAAGLAAGVIVARYVAADPFEYDLRNLRSAGEAAAEARRWIELSDRTFGKSISGRAYIAADRPDQVPQIVAALRAVEAELPPERRAIGGISSILDVVPGDQPQRIAVLREIRALVDDPAIETLDDGARTELEALRPPDDLRPITAGDLPGEICEQLVERDGRIGLLVAVKPGASLNQWNGVDLVRFAGAVRTVRLASGETVTSSGSSVIFADILAAVAHDGPRVTLVAATALAVLVLVVVGFNRRAAAVACATALGTAAMVAICALAGLKVHFLDFVALPITLGLGVDYAINLASRAEETGSAAEALRTSGTAVAVCSLTTVIGYGSLLVNDNLAIRGFGLASLVGELTCLFAAFLVVPILLRAGPRRPRATADAKDRRLASLVLGAIVTLGACGERRIEVTSTDDHKQQKLVSAIADFVAAGRTPAAFATLARQARELRPMSRELALEAERRVMVLAAWPVKAAVTLSIERQVDELALTVWPTLVAAPLTFDDEDARPLPAPDESARSYVARLCAELADAGCAAAAPQDQPHVMAVYVAGRALERTRTAVDACRECRQDPGWHDAVRDWEEIERAASFRGTR